MALPSRSSSPSFSTPAFVLDLFLPCAYKVHPLSSDFAKEASYYLEYFPVSAFEKEIDNDIGKVPFSDFLFTRFKLFWIGGLTSLFPSLSLPSQFLFVILYPLSVLIL